MNTAIVDLIYDRATNDPKLLRRGMKLPEDEWRILLEEMGQSRTMYDGTLMMFHHVDGAFPIVCSMDGAGDGA